MHAQTTTLIRIDAHTTPAFPTLVRGLDAMLERRCDVVAGERAALTPRCRIPTGELIVGNAVCELRAGCRARWAGVTA